MVSIMVHRYGSVLSIVLEMKYESHMLGGGGGGGGV